MAVAKSYQNLEQVGAPYEARGKKYVMVKYADGTTRQVRWYTDEEYAKMYGVAPESVPHSRKEALGFKNGYITIFKGDTYSLIDWFKASSARYTRAWGWYFVSTEELPDPLPVGIEPIRLTWEEVSTDDVLHDEDTIKKYVETLVYEPSASEFVGKIGDRLDVELTVVKAIQLDGYYGPSTLHTFVDANGNEYVWTTASKTLEEGVTYRVKGTVKDHKVYKNTNQTVLTRCRTEEVA